MADPPSLSDRTSGKLDPTVVRMLEQVRLPICVTDPHADDNPIVYVNSAFLDLTGYTATEVLNRNCRFLQGADTREESIDAVRQAVHERLATTVDILNYRKDGSAFENALQIGPIEDGNGNIILRFGLQIDVTEKRLAERRAAQAQMEERSHRLRNIVNVMSVAIRMSAREASDVTDFARTVTERLELLGQAHFLTFEKAITMPVKDVVLTILQAYAPFGDSQTKVTGPNVELAPTQLTSLTLALHELATNPVKHGALGAGNGRVTVTWDDPDGPDPLAIVWTERGGPAVTRPAREGGSRIIRTLIESGGGSLDQDWQPSGLVVRLSLGR